MVLSISTFDAKAVMTYNYGIPLTYSSQKMLASTLFAMLRRIADFPIQLLLATLVAAIPYISENRLQLLSI